MVDDKENLPPTHSPNSRQRDSSIPHCTAVAGCAVAATKRDDHCGTALEIHARARFALCMVSRVVKVFDDTTTTVRAGSNP